MITPSLASQSPVWPFWWSTWPFAAASMAAVVVSWGTPSKGGWPSSRRLVLFLLALHGGIHSVVAKEAVRRFAAHPAQSAPDGTPDSPNALIEDVTPLRDIVPRAGHEGARAHVLPPTPTSPLLRLLRDSCIHRPPLECVVARATSATWLAESYRHHPQRGRVCLPS